MLVQTTKRDYDAAAATLFLVVGDGFAKCLVVLGVGLRGAKEPQPLAVVRGERPGAEEPEVLVLVVVESLWVPRPLRGKSTELGDLV